MPRWQDTLSSDQVQQLVAFLGAPGSAASSPAPPAPAPPAPGAAAPPAADVATTSQVNVTLNEWKLLPSPASVHFGTIHFNASNTGAKPHDLVVIKTNLDQASLPMTADGQQADASAAGEVVGTIVSSQLQSGASAAIALDLSPGNYVLICNVAHHYTNGMHAAFTVTQGARAAGLPLTGSRARAGGAGPSWWPIALAAVALVSLAGGVVMRRRA
jgi:uncharacterized cupredoxin-like copper-binding protein